MMPRARLTLSCAALFTTSLLSPRAEAQVQFVDVTVPMGVDYIQNQTPLIASEAFVMTGAAAAGDYDGDGWTDLIVTRADDAALLFRNKGRDLTGASRGFEEVGHFAFKGQPPAARSNGVAWGDIDNDGDLDLFVTSLFTERYHLYVNGGNGRFNERAMQRGLAMQSPDRHQGFCPSFGDYDRDGYLDLYVTEWGFHRAAAVGNSTSRLMRNLGAANPGHFVDQTDLAGVSIEDTIATGVQGQFPGVYSFTAHWSDLDDDGWPDLAIAGDFLTSRLFWNDGNGAFNDGTLSAGVGTDENGMGATVADFNGDGLLDWFVTSIFDPVDTCNTLGGCNWQSSGNRLYMNSGNRTFSDQTDTGVRDGGWGWGATHLDFDNDGDRDLAMTNGIIFAGNPTEDFFNTDAMRLWRNDGAGFVEVGAGTGVTDTRSGKGLLAFDYDRDGDQDLFVTNNGEHPVLYRNDGGNAAHWLQVKLKGTTSNTFGIGAKVRVWASANATPQLLEMSASSNFLGQNEPIAHFGMGANANVHQVEVKWPSGAVSTLNNMSADQRLTIVE
ncbi:MAG: hypothetical protein ACI835_001055 [Planctomycetota bacterium]|jgi:hypothetical protein